MATVRPSTSGVAASDVGGWRLAAACGALLAAGCEAPIDLGVARHCAEGTTPCPGADGGVECVDLVADPSNCGACGRRCADGVATLAACVAGECAGRCAAGRAECDGDPANGCETDTGRDRFHCGGCGVRCELGVGCAEGRCVLRNVATGRPAQQSSMYMADRALRGPEWALDGRLCMIAARYGGEDGWERSCPTSRTEAVAGSWWQVDLGAPVAVARLDLWQPLDFAVRVEGSDDGESWRALGAAEPQSVPPLRIELGTSVRWVRVVRPSADFLDLSEVEVWRR